MNITIDGKAVECENGEYLLDVAARNGINIPTLCHHEALKGLGSCRVCIVETEIDGRRDIVASCVYPLERDCAVYTDSDRVRRHRRMILALLQARAPGSIEIARLCEEYGTQKYRRFSARSKGDGSGDTKCILCGLCVKACESLGTGAIGTVGRGVEKKVSTPYDEPALVCVGCGSCAAVCPTGAIELKEDSSTRTIWGKEFDLEFCKECGAVTGTAFEMYRAANRIGAEPPELCGDCRKKAITGVMASTYGK